MHIPEGALCWGFVFARPDHVDYDVYRSNDSHDLDEVLSVGGRAVIPRQRVVAPALVAAALVISGAGPALGAQEPESGRYSIVVPAGIDESELEVIAGMLMLSEEQDHWLHSAWGEYVREWEGLLKVKLPQLLDLSKAAWLSNQGDGAYSADALAALRSFRDVEEDIVRETSKIDEQLFHRLEAILSDEQRKRLPRVVVRHARRRCASLMLQLDLPAARIDLSKVLEQRLSLLELDQAASAVLEEYETALSHLCLQVRHRYWQDHRKHAELFHEVLFDAHGQRRDTMAAESAGSVTRFREGVAAVQGASFGLQRRIASLNKAYLPRLAETLPADAGGWLVQAVRNEAYPAVYPDPIDMSPLISRMITSREISAEQAALVQVFAERYRSRWTDASRAMESLCDDWYEHVARYRNLDGREDVQTRMRSLRIARTELAAEFMEQVRGALPTGALAPLRHALDDFEQALVVARRQSAATVFP